MLNQSDAITDDALSEEIVGGLGHGDDGDDFAGSLVEGLDGREDFAVV